MDLVGTPRAQSYLRRVLFGASSLELAVLPPRPAGSTAAEAVLPKWGFPDERQSWSWRTPGARVRVGLWVWCV